MGSDGRSPEVEEAEGRAADIFISTSTKPESQLQQDI
jgi:hypothetical protein